MQPATVWWVQPQHKLSEGDNWFRRKMRRNLQGRPAGCSRWQLCGEGKYDGSHNGQPEPLRQQHLGPHACIYSHTLLRISFRSTVKLSSCYKQSFLSSLHTVWDLTRASCCVVEGGEKKLKGEQIIWGGKIQKEEGDRNRYSKSLPQAHYVICVISYEQMQLTSHMLSMPLPVLNINLWLHLHVWDWRTAYSKAGGLNVCDFCTPGLLLFQSSKHSLSPGLCCYHAYSRHVCLVYTEYMKTADGKYSKKTLQTRSFTLPTKNNWKNYNWVTN